MTKTDQRMLKRLARRLGEWYVSYGRQFRWRRGGVDHYRLIVTEVMLQRTRAKSVARFEPGFFKKYPAWEALAKSTETNIADTLDPIGLQTRRAAVLKKLSVEMVQRSGIVPSDREGIESLPGVGQYVANAIELLVFDRPRPLLDTNMARVIERFIRPRQLADIRYDPWLQSSAQYLVEQGDPRVINWAVLDFAAIVCKPRKPACTECPVSGDCAYFSSI